MRPRLRNRGAPLRTLLTASLCSLCSLIWIGSLYSITKVTPNPALRTVHLPSTGIQELRPPNTFSSKPRANGTFPAPSSYQSILDAYPVHEAAYSIDSILDACQDSVGGDIVRQFHEGAKGECGKRLDLASFVCSAQCAREEPELLRTFGTLGIAKYELHGLLRLCQAGSFPFLVRLQNGRVFAHKCQANPTGTHAFRTAMSLLQDLACTVELPDTIFGFDGNDYALPQNESPLKYASAGWVHPLPGVVRFVGTDAHPTALFPTPPFISGSGLYTPFPEEDEFEAWEDRADDLFWRGGSTGIPFDYDYVWMMPRMALLSRVHGREGYDVALTSTDGISSKMKANGVLDAVSQSRRFSKAEMAHFKYQFHIDGNTASWGLAYKLRVGAVVLWQNSPSTYREFYYALLKPWEHYVPLRADLGNLEHVRLWLNSEEGKQEAKAIHNRLVTFVQSRLRPEDLLCYVTRLMYSLYELQAFEAQSIDDFQGEFEFQFESIDSLFKK
mmetsp:Transcript_18929/g.35051  ORF Transcript_18929/g.35051 Transcript_18929/m.35051 type:complete len:500 (+) Transcript_18929:89-1588(+)